MSEGLDNLERWANEAIARRDALRKEHPGLFNSPAQVTLVLKREPRGDRMRLAGRHGPLGAVLCSAADGEATVAFGASDILAWVHRTRKRIAQ